MGKTSRLTGSQKKAQKAELKTQKRLNEKAVKEVERAEPYRRKARVRQEEIAKGKHHLPSDLGDIVKNFERAGKGAEKIFAPIKEQAISDYQKFTQPSIASQFSPGSSAAKQALSQSQMDLQRSISSDFANLQSNLAQNLTGQSYGNKLSNLNARMQANNQFMGGQPSPVISGIGAASPYMQKEDQGPGAGAMLGGEGIKAAAMIAAAKIAASSYQVKENIRDYERGLETLDYLEVKQYDYKTEEYGRQHDRVGLIAETVPEELQAELGNVLGVDVYGLVGLLINAVKELKQKVEKLEAVHV